MFAANVKPCIASSALYLVVRVKVLKKKKKKILYLHLSHRAARKFHTSFLKFIIYKKFRDHTRAKSWINRKVIREFVERGKDLFSPSLKSFVMNAAITLVHIIVSQITHPVAHSICDATIEQSISHDIILFTSLGTGETLIPRSLHPSPPCSIPGFSLQSRHHSPVGHVTPRLSRTTAAL